MAKEYCLYSAATLYFPFIKDNICFYETNTTDEVERVMNEVGLRSLVIASNGMYERIGEGGRMLSGGQEQRVAMARAF